MSVMRPVAGKPEATSFRNLSFLRQVAGSDISGLHPNRQEKMGMLDSFDFLDDVRRMNARQVS